MFAVVFACMALLLGVQGVHNGDDIDWNRHGYLVKILLRERNTDNATACTGTLISPSAVLTSIKCFPNLPETTYDGVLIIALPKTKKTLKRAMLSVHAEGEVAVIKIHKIQTKVCEPAPAPPRVARLNIKPTLLKTPWNHVDPLDLVYKHCRLVGFKTEDDPIDSVESSKAMSVELKLKEDSETLMFAEVSDAGTACWDDIGAPLECALNEEDVWVQVGLLDSIYAQPPNEDWDVSNATCSDIKTMRFAVFADESLPRSVELIDKVGVFAVYDDCEF
ncbi:unnamed protein product [Caenorhabditis auriculariae]|uniref:Peptidase S1 domain-containing protein n=1 Tax=Caenorhabditis auriculariae TaxID=2777116 RepID=A0A8S1H2G4_9PELO|nr:unnamed protein product [Caenorhabditis auriculariae]